MSLTAHALETAVRESVEALCEAGAKLNFENDGSPPPLHQAAEAQLDVVPHFLLARGALPTERTGKRGCHWRSSGAVGEPQVVRTLLEAGATPRPGRERRATRCESARSVCRGDPHIAGTGDRVDEGREDAEEKLIQGTGNRGHQGSASLYRRPTGFAETK